MASLKGLADARAWARAEPHVDPEWSAVAVLPQLLDAEDIALLHRAAQQCGERLAATGGGPFSGGGLCDTLSRFAHDAFSDEHIALYLHYDSFLQRECPALFAKLHAAMIEHPDVPSDPARLRLRCAELHSYAEGGGLLAPSHRDDGSTLTLSVLLSEADGFGGGRVRHVARRAAGCTRAAQGRRGSLPLVPRAQRRAGHAGPTAVARGRALDQRRECTGSPRVRMCRDRLSPWLASRASEPLSGRLHTRAPCRGVPHGINK